MNARLFLFYVGLGWLVLILESTLLNYMGAGVVHLDLLMAITVRLGVGRYRNKGLMIVLIYVWLLGLFSGHGAETYVLAYPLVHEAVALASARFNLRGRWTQSTIVLIMSGCAESIREVLPILFSDSMRLHFDADWVATHMVLSGVGAYMMFPMLRRAEAHFGLPQSPRALRDPSGIHRQF